MWRYRESWAFAGWLYHLGCFLEPGVDLCWQNYSSVIISNYVKLLGWIPGEKKQVPTRLVNNLVNWSVPIARYAIHRSAVDFKSRSEVTSVVAIFRAVVKAHIHFQCKIYSYRGKQPKFLQVWCIGQAFANVENNRLVFKLWFCMCMLISEIL